MAAPGSLKRRRGAAALPALGLALVLGLACAGSARADCKLQTLELPVKMAGSRAVATVGINGTTVPLTVDSGAFYSILTEAAAAQLKLRLRPLDNVRVEGITGSVVAYSTRVDTLKLLKGDIPRVEFIVGGNEPGAGTMGLLGRNILSFTDTEYDLAHGAIRFLFPNDDCGDTGMAYWAGTTPVTEIDLLRSYRDNKVPAIRARVKLNGHELVALFDTGATTVVSARAARKAGVEEAAMTPYGTMHGAGRGSAKAWIASFETFQIGGETISNNRLRVGDFTLDDADMLLGIDFFLSHRIYVSKKQDKLYFTYAGGKVFAANSSAAASAVEFDADPTPGGASTETADQLARRGAAAAARGQYPNALADLDRACELDPASATFLTQRGTVHEALRQPKKALQDFDKALELEPSHAEARAHRATLRALTRDAEGARADLDVLDKAVAAQAQVRLQMAQLYLTLDQPAQALPQLNQWLAAHPHEAGRDAALNNRCRVRARLGVELDAALDDCNDAIDTDDKIAGYFDSRGWVLLRLGKPKKALADFDRSVELQPDRALFSLYGRGLTKLRLGDAAGGQADLAAVRKKRQDIDLEVARTGLPTAADRVP